MRKFLSIMLLLSCFALLFTACGDKQAKEGEGLSVTFNNEQGEIPKQTEPLEPLNEALEKEEIEFEGDTYGAIINNASASDIDAKDIETFDYENGSDTIVVMPYYEGSKIRIESVTFDAEQSIIKPVDTLFESVSTEDYALVLTVNRPEGAMPQLRITVEYDDVVYSNLIKNQPDSDIEYIR